MSQRVLSGFENRKPGFVYLVLPTASSLWIGAELTDLGIATWAGHRSLSFTKDR